MEKTDTQISVRITSEFKARLERQAEKERRSVSNLIIKVMEEYLDSQEKPSESRGHFPSNRQRRTGAGSSCPALVFL